MTSDKWRLRKFWTHAQQYTKYKICFSQFWCKINITAEQHFSADHVYANVKRISYAKFKWGQCISCRRGAAAMIEVWLLGKNNLSGKIMIGRKKHNIKVKIL